MVDMLISQSLHNSLTIIAILACTVLFITSLKTFRLLFHHVNIIYKAQRNVLLLQSKELSPLIDVLSYVNDIISVHPRQIRRILRSALDSNIVKEVPASRPTLHLKQPRFYKNDASNQYVLNFNAFTKQPPSLHDDAASQRPQTRCFDCYFGVPKSYYFQLKSITRSSNNANIVYDKNNPRSKSVSSLLANTDLATNGLHDGNRVVIPSPFQSLVGFATEAAKPMIERVNSRSLHSKSSLDDAMMHKDYDDDLGKLAHSKPAAHKASSDDNEGGIEMIDLAAMTTEANAGHEMPDRVKLDSPSFASSCFSFASMITLQRLIPNEYVHREFVESKNDANISFEDDDLESTINTIIGNRRDALVKKPGPVTKYKVVSKSQEEKQSHGGSHNHSSGDEQEVDENEFYFCVLLSYVRTPMHAHDEEAKRAEADDVKHEDEVYRKQMYESDDSNDEEKQEIQQEEEEKEAKPEPKKAVPVVDRTESNENNFELIEENGVSYKIDSVEISIFEPPSAFSRTSQHSSVETRKKKKKPAANNVRGSSKSVTIENALDPTLSTQLLCDFHLQRLVEYYDIFGISDVDLNDNGTHLECKICFSYPSNIILLPCRHCCCCYNCYKHIEQCPMCRKPIRQTLRWNSETVE